VQPHAGAAREPFGADQRDRGHRRLPRGPGELRVVAAIEAHGLRRRSLVSTMEERSLKLLRARHPEIRLGWSVPRLRRDPLRNPVVMGPAVVLMHYMRQALPSVAANRIRRGEIDALMAHWRLATPRLVRATRAAAGELYVWTVDDADRIAQLERMGVSGVISNDPRLFAAPSGPSGGRTTTP